MAETTFPPNCYYFSISLVFVNRGIKTAGRQAEYRLNGDEKLLLRTLFFFFVNIVEQILYCDCFKFGGKFFSDSCQPAL